MYMLQMLWMILVIKTRLQSSGGHVRAIWQTIHIHIYVHTYPDTCMHHTIRIHAYMHTFSGTCMHQMLGLLPQAAIQTRLPSTRRHVRNRVCSMWLATHISLGPTPTPVLESIRQENITRHILLRNQTFCHYKN
jgi:hypothetical protein